MRIYSIILIILGAWFLHLMLNCNDTCNNNNNHATNYNDNNHATNYNNDNNANNANNACNNRQVDNFTDLSTILLAYNMCEPPTELKNILDKRNLSYNVKSDDYFIPCTYDYCERDAITLEKTSSDKKLFLIDGCDVIASKIDLWRKIEDQFGENAIKYMPQTHIISDDNFVEKFTNHYNANKLKRHDQMYVLKNYRQRQEGIKLTRDLDTIINGAKDGWLLAQDYQYDPYLIDKRKINFRYYLLIICKDNVVSGYVHKNGFVYYTADYYDEQDIDFTKHITTGYVDRIVYETNPLTLEDFRNHLEEKQEGSSKTWDNNANDLLKNTMLALSKRICTNMKLQNHLKFQLFGCDLAPRSDLSCTLMEINKGPDLNCKDDRDCNVKRKVQDDIFSIVEENKLDATDFIKIY
jgi:hypothetical protein